MHAQWSPTEWGLEELLGELRGIYNAPVIIGMTVATDDKNSSVRIIQVINQKADCFKKFYLAENLCDLLPLLSLLIVCIMRQCNGRFALRSCGKWCQYCIF